MKKNEVSKLVKIFDPKMFVYDFVKWTGALPTLLYMRLKTHYISDEAKKLRHKPALVVSNHTGYTDPLTINTLLFHRRICSVATQELFEHKVFGKFLSKCGCIPINKDNVSVKTFKMAKEIFERGHYVAIFPEGQVVKEGQIVEYKLGAVMLAYIAGVPIIPIYIKKKSKWWHRQRVVVGEKIDINQFVKSSFMTTEDMKDAANYIREKEKELELELTKKEKKLYGTCV